MLKLGPPMWFQLKLGLVEVVPAGISLAQLGYFNNRSHETHMTAMSTSRNMEETGKISLSQFEVWLP